MDDPTLKLSQPLTYVKAIYATLIGFIGALVTALTVGGLEPVSWLSAALAGLVAGGGVLGLTNRPVR